MKKNVGFLFVFCVLLVLPAFFACNKVCIADKNSNFAISSPCTSLKENTAENESACFVVSANSAVVFANANFAAKKIVTLNHKEQVFVLTEDGSPVAEYYDNFKFLKINLAQNNIKSEDFEFGFIYESFLVPKQEEIVAIPNFNAKTNKDCQVYVKQNNKFMPTSTTLSRGQEIFLYEGFSEKKDFIAISYVHDNIVLYGYLKMVDISPNGINPLLITCIVLIVAVLSIIFAWLFIKGKHVRLKKQKPGKYDLNKNQ